MSYDISAGVVSGFCNEPGVFEDEGLINLSYLSPVLVLMVLQYFNRSQAAYFGNFRYEIIHVHVTWYGLIAGTPQMPSITLTANPEDSDIGNGTTGLLPRQTVCHGILSIRIRPRCFIFRAS